jgi:hypothetical protein
MPAPVNRILAMHKFKIGVVLDDNKIDLQIASFLSWVKDQNSIVVSQVFVAPNAKDRGLYVEKPELPGRLTRWRPADQLFKAMLVSEKVLLKYFSKYMARLSIIDDTQYEASKLLGTMPIPLSLDDDVGTIARQLNLGNFDLILNLSSGPIDKSLLATSRLGALQLDYRRGRMTRRAPIGFWETYYRMPLTKFAISKTSIGRANEEILLEGSFRTQFSFLLNQTHLYKKSLAQLRQMLVRVLEKDELPRARLAPSTANELLDKPDAVVTSTYYAKLLIRLASKAVRRALRIKEKWGIQIAHADWASAASIAAIKISAPNGHFWADPFLYTRNGRTYCFVEDFLYATKRAHISVLEVSEKGVIPLGVALQEDFHLSFPYIFSYAGRTFMCPEASESHQIRIYECKEFPLKWELSKVAMNGISAADSMFFEHNGKWWLMTSVDRTELNDHCSELCLFYADSPLADEWIPHPQNPLYVDANIGRNAGLIIESGRILRAAQEQGFDQYGKGSALYEIVKLDENDYEEIKLTDLKRVRPKNCLASHHISTTGKVTVVDFLSHSFSP